MKKLFITMLFIAAMQIYGQEKITLDEGTLVKCKLAQDINGKDLNVGDKIKFFLDEDITKNNIVVVSKGSKILGTVTEAKGSRMMGKKGKLSFTIDYLYINDTKVVKLRSSVTKNLKGSGVAIATTAVLLTPFTLLFNGKNAKYQKNTVFESYIDENTTI